MFSATRPEAAASSSEPEPSVRQPSKRPEESLITSLRQKAAEYARTGVDPELVESLSEALQHHPGTERAARLREMQNCDKALWGIRSSD